MLMHAIQRDDCGCLKPPLLTVAGEGGNNLWFKRRNIRIYAHAERLESFLHQEFNPQVFLMFKKKIYMYKKVQQQKSKQTQPSFWEYLVNTLAPRQNHVRHITPLFCCKLGVPLLYTS